MKYYYKDENGVEKFARESSNEYHFYCEATGTASKTYEGADKERRRKVLVNLDHMNNLQDIMNGKKKDKYERTQKELKEEWWATRKNRMRYIEAKVYELYTK